MKRGTIEHPKTAMLAQELGVELLTAVGLLEALWHFTAKYTPRGDVGRYTSEHIKRGVYWYDDEARLIGALVKCRWLDEDRDHHLLVHDWADHADDSVRKKLKRAGEDFIRRSEQNGGPPCPDKTPGQDVRTKCPEKSGQSVRPKCPDCPDKTAGRPAQPSRAQPEPEPEPSPTSSAPSPPAPPADGHGQETRASAGGRYGHEHGQLVELLVANEVHLPVAERLALRYTPQRIRQVVNHVGQTPGLRNRAGRLVKLLQRSRPNEMTENGRFEQRIEAERSARKGGRAPDPQPINRTVQALVASTEKPVVGQLALQRRISSRK